MSKRIYSTGMNEETFEEYLKACCDTLMRNKDLLYQHYTDRTRINDIVIRFPLRVDCIATMELYTEKAVYSDNESIEMKLNDIKEEGEE